MRKLLVALAIALTTLGAMAPAGARTTSSSHVTLSTRGGYVAPHACVHSRVGYRIVVDEASISDLRAWSADVTITGPGGYRQTDFVYGDTDAPGWHSTFFCASPNRAGRYRVTTRVDITHDTTYQGTHTYETLSTTFDVTTRR